MLYRLRRLIGGLFLDYCRNLAWACTWSITIDSDIQSSGLQNLAAAQPPCLKGDGWPSMSCKLVAIVAVMCPLLPFLWVGVLPFVRDKVGRKGRQEYLVSVFEFEFSYPSLGKILSGPVWSWAAWASNVLEGTQQGCLCGLDLCEDGSSGVEGARSYTRCNGSELRMPA
jgi:hypothetical protein